MTRAALIAAPGILLAASAPAAAHVDVRPTRAPAGADAHLAFEVENERSNAATRMIVIDMPRGAAVERPLSIRGWRMTTRGAAGGRVTLTAPSGRELTVGEHGDFRLLVGLPRREGATLTFKVLQRYDNGETVRWIGPPGTAEPAPALRLTAARDPAPEPREREPRAPSAGDTAAAPDTSSGDENGEGGVPIWAGIGLILLAAVAGSTLARRRNRRRLERRG